MDYILDLQSNLIVPNLEGIIPSKSYYLTEDIFTSYFDKIILDSFILNNKSLCLMNSVFVSDYFIKIDFIDFKYKIPNTFLKSLTICKADNNIRFYIIPIALVFSYTSAHSNVIIVDNLNKTIEFFEPHGQQYSGIPKPYSIQYHIRILLNTLFPIRSKTYTFKNVQNSCPIGLQQLQNISNPTSGHCLAWSLLFLQLKIQNLLVSTDTIINYLINIYNIDLYMRKFIGFLELYTLFIPKKQSNYTSELILNKQEQKNIINRIELLTNLYKNKLDNNDNNDNDDIFEELISYHKFPNFNKIFFNSMNRSTTNTSNHKKLKLI